jgi:hypothetical protein
MDTERAYLPYGLEQAGLTTSEKSASVFQPDTLLAAQYCENRRRKALEPEEKLVLAILEDAINCFQENHLARQGRRKRLFDEVRQWIFGPERDWVFGFENICGVVGFDPEYIRGGLERWKAKEVSKQRNARTTKYQLARIETRRKIAMCAV